ncbi:uncharacterized protein LOC141827163 [Curcuma longa]|uniref:uncharacterized protein LOC141827163 n=1 Tax=Curcuma longa TaxID=136217 RepID=UPI003D9E3FCD
MVGQPQLSAVWEGARNKNAYGSFVEQFPSQSEDAVHAISVRRAAPDWLHVVPGSSYWIPPPRRVGGVVDLVRKLAYPLTEEDTMSLTTIRGWPSSAYFVEAKSITGASPHSVKRNMKEASAQSDDAD